MLREEKYLSPLAEIKLQPFGCSFSSVVAITTDLSWLLSVQFYSYFIIRTYLASLPFHDEDPFFKVVRVNVHEPTLIKVINYI
jgi:hypothetical protein